MRARDFCASNTGPPVLHHGRFQTWEDSMRMLCIDAEPQETSSNP